MVRLSGAGAFAVAARVVDGFRAEPPRQAHLALFRSPDGSPIDRGIYLAFPGPHSYTGEDTVEFSCHGGLLAPARLLAALHECGARAASPGEFTRRAVLNGKLDLLQAEAVGDLIDASAPVQGRAALRQLDGGLSRRLLALRERLIELMAVLGYEVDFPEEDDAPVSRPQIAGLLEGARQDVAALLATAPVGERLREGALVVFAGRPNAGKSSLFNALLGVDRALVTEVPGTTRDTIEAATAMDGWPIRLADTAGLWDAPDRVDQLGMAVSRKYLGAADLVLLCVEATRSPEPDELAIRSEYQTVVVRTKGDLSDGRSVGPQEDEVVVSAATATGIEALRSLVAKRLFGAGQGGYAELEPMLTQERHRVALSRAERELAEAYPHLSPAGDTVLAAHHLRMAVTALDELVGAVDTEDVLERIFSRFCVGK